MCFAYHAGNAHRRRAARKRVEDRERVVEAIAVCATLSSTHTGGTKRVVAKPCHAIVRARSIRERSIDCRCRPRHDHVADKDCPPRERPVVCERSSRAACRVPSRALSGLHGRYPWNCWVSHRSNRVTTEQPTLRLIIERPIARKNWFSAISRG